jgi:hypothetical protein
VTAYAAILVYVASAEGIGELKVGKRKIIITVIGIVSYGGQLFQLAYYGIPVFFYHCLVIVGHGTGRSFEFQSSVICPQINVSGSKIFHKADYALSV